MNDTGKLLDNLNETVAVQAQIITDLLDVMNELVFIIEGTEGLLDSQDVEDAVQEAKRLLQNYHEQP